MCWTRETGVVPAALVGVLAGLGVPHTDVYAAVVALAIVADPDPAGAAGRLARADGSGCSTASVGAARGLDGL